MNDFFLFSLPNSSDFFVINSDDGNGEYSVEITSFDEKKKIQFISSSVKPVDIEKTDIDFHIDEVVENTNSVSKQEYISKIESCVSELKSNSSIDKVVLSRKKIIPIDKEINYKQTILNLKKRFPNTLVYLFKKNNEVWLGATPELLASLNEDNFKTISLAGTLPVDEAFSDKEYEEQEMVTQFIKDILGKYTQSVKVSNLKEINYNNIKHLVTEFQAKISSNEFEKLIEKIHPTPAICGLPQDKSFVYIQENENYNRNFYSGKININLENQKIAYVNLRCMKVYSNAIELYAGGGITSSSNSEKEWTETELKMQLILNELAFI
ncbi:MAG: chorismate-binding protein [Flavobacteriales bacterium]|nr:chorismate-binding protein [Flavobacteriales bacterium]